MVNRVRGPTPRPQLRRQSTKRSKAPKAGAESQHVESGTHDMGDMDMGDTTDDGDNDGQQKGHHRAIVAHRGRKSSVTGLREDLAASEAEAESGAATTQGIMRKGMGGSLGDSGFQQREHSREAYEQSLRGHVETDAARFETLREGGAVDSFNPDNLPRDIEKLGQLGAANHMVRMIDHWLLQGLDRATCIETATSWLSEFERSDNVRKVLQELESKPIRDVYPLELLLNLVESEPEKFPDLKQENLLSQSDELNGTRPVYEGHAIFIPVPKGFRLKSFALLDGGRPGYEFYPSPTRPDCYELLIDTAGTWRFALLGVSTRELGGGKIVKEDPQATIDVFTIVVQKMGRKDAGLVDSDDEPSASKPVDAEIEAPAKTPGGSVVEQLVAERKQKQAKAKAAVARSQAADGDAPADGAVNVAALSRQVADALKNSIRKNPSRVNKAQTYTLDFTFFVPGDYPTEFDRNELLHLAVEDAAPFDEVWDQALAAIGTLLEQWEPEAAPPSQEELRRALRRARVQ